MYGRSTSGTFAQGDTRSGPGMTGRGEGMTGKEIPGQARDEGKGPGMTGGEALRPRLQKIAVLRYLGRNRGSDLG